MPDHVRWRAPIALGGTGTLDALMTCPSCANPVPGEARFCPSCGAVVAPAGDEERRVVTVLFADLVGFTTLAEHWDPEQVKRFVDALFERLVSDVERFGGRVDKVLGDGIVALFGAPVAHEDDAERAVRAGLEMQATLARFRAEHGTNAGVEMRIGINTGEVLVGTLAGTDYTAMGDVVNTAARFQELSPIGAVLVGDATRELCSAAAQFQAREPVQLRGREQPSGVWVATAWRSVGARRWQSDVAFVGRGAELGMLRSIVDVVIDRQSAIVSVVGEAGVGKSRIVDEVVGPMLDAHPDTLLLEGACAPYGETNVWWPVAGSALEQLGLDRHAAPDQARSSVVDRLERFSDFESGSERFEWAAEVVMHILGQPSALDDLGASAARDAVFAVVLGVLAHRSAEAPVVIWVDDVQWAAPLLLELLELVARQLANQPVLIVTTYRPSDEGAREWPPPVEPAVALHLPLAPLDRDESMELVGHVSGRAVAEPTAERLFERSGGNPLFLIELTRLATSPDGDAEDRDLPGTLRALIAARLDQLSAGQRVLLDNAAILGNDGRVEALQQFASELDQTFDLDDLRSLEAGGLMLLDGARWRFRSDVVREVAYLTLTKQARAQRHAGVAAYLAKLPRQVVDRQAHHAAAAAELVQELGPVKGVPHHVSADAVDLLGRAAERWYQQGGHRRGIEVVERALGLVEVGSSSHRHLLLIHVEGLVETRQLQRARGEITELMHGFDAVDDRVMQGEVFRLLGTVEQMDGDLVAARDALGRAVSIFRELSDDAHLAEALRARGFAEIFGGSLADAESFLAEAQDLFEAVGDRRGLAWVLQHQAWVSFLAGDHDAAEARLNVAIDAFGRLGDRAGRAWSIGLLAFVHHFGRRHDDAARLAAEALEEANQWGDSWGAAMMLNLQASIHLWSGDPEVARRRAERSLSVFRRIGDRFGMIQALSTLTRALVAAGRYGEAERGVEELLALSDSFGELAYPAIAAAGTAMHLGNGPRAVELADDAVGRLGRTGANIDEGRVILAFGHLLAGEPEQSLTVLLDADVESSGFARAARATASALTGDRELAAADARAVMALDGVSYWDRLVAQVAAAASIGGDDGRAAREDLLLVAADLTDVPMRSYAQWVARRLLGDEPGDEPERGWRDVAHRLVELAPD